MLTRLPSTVLTTLNAACIQQPTPGNTVSIQGSLFSTTPVNITSPTPTPTGVNYTNGSLTLGAKIGIAAGGVVVLLSIAGFCIVWNGKRRRRQYLRKVQEQSGYNDWRKNNSFTPEDGLRGGPFAQRATPPMSSAAFFDSPDSQRPLNPPWAAKVEDESPVSAFGEKAYFSPYSSQYSSPISATDHLPVAMEWPIDRKGSLGGGRTSGRSMSGRNGSGRMQSRSRSREKKGDQFEMQDVAPVLLHPGHGRAGSVGLTEEDAKRGAAL
jgi:hypothetical protein